MRRINKYHRRPKISEAKFRQLVRCFALDLTATNAAELTGLSTCSANDVYLKIRRRLAEACKRTAFTGGGDVEVDESYFGPRPSARKRGRGAGDKTIVFGIFEQEGRVYTEIVPDARNRTLQAVIRGRVGLAKIVHSDGWRGYDGLVDVGYRKHFRVRHREDCFAKRRLAKFCGVPKHTFWLHLKECEWRFNHRDSDLYQSGERNGLPRRSGAYGLLAVAHAPNRHACLRDHGRD